jgi:adenylate cyclase
MTFEFGPFKLDSAAGVLWRGEAAVILGQRALALLSTLLERPGEVVSKDDLLSAAWPNQIVAENNLTVQMATLRQALGDGPDGAGLIATVARRGYRFTAGVRQVREPPAAEQSTADRPSIAILPFDNMSGDPEQGYFSDGITYDIISALSKFSGLLVIAGNSSFRYRGFRVDIAQLARELRVHYVLEGGVRRNGDRIRIAARLVEVSTGAHLWAETYERTSGDLFAIQDEAVESIVSVLVAYVTRAEQERARRKAPGDWRAYDCYLRGIDLARSWAYPGYLHCRQMMQRAIAIDPGFASAYPTLAATYVRSWNEPSDPLYLDTAALDLALSAARRALELDPLLPEGHAMMGWTLLWQRQHDQAIAAYERALEINPNLADWRYGHILAHAGRAEDGIEALRRAHRLDPFMVVGWHGFLGHAYLTLRRYDDALGPLRECAARAPSFWPSQGWLASLCGHVGLHTEARRAVESIRTIMPNFDVGDWQRMAPYKYEDDLTHVLDGLCLAGMPESRPRPN